MADRITAPLRQISVSLRLVLLLAIAGLSLPLQALESGSLEPVLDEISLPDLSGQTRTFEHWKGRTILLNFWASWCTPCQYEIPHLVRYQQQYADKNLQVIGIGLDDRRKLENVKRSLGINYPVLVIEQFQGADLMAKLGNPQQVVPYTMVIRADGQVMHTQRGQFDDESFDLFVKPLLARP